MYIFSAAALKEPSSATVQNELSWNRVTMFHPPHKDCPQKSFRYWLKYLRRLISAI
jgi:hypothetical protein